MSASTAVPTATPIPLKTTAPNAVYSVNSLTTDDGGEGERRPLQQPDDHALLHRIGALVYSRHVLAVERDLGRSDHHCQLFRTKAQGLAARLIVR